MVTVWRSAKNNIYIVHFFGHRGQHIFYQLTYSLRLFTPKSIERKGIMLCVVIFSHVYLVWTHYYVDNLCKLFLAVDNI